MAKLMRRYFFTVYLVAFAIAGLLGARAWATMNGWEPPADPILTPPAPPAKPWVARDKSGGALAERNMFCSTCEPAEAGPPVTPVRRGPLPLSLIATHRVAGGDESFATLRHQETERVGAYHVGDRIPGAGILERVGARYVLIRVGEAEDDLARVELDGITASADHATSAGPASTGAPLTGFAAEVEEGVRKIDDLHYEVDRALLQKVLGNPTAIKGARVSLTKGGGIKLSSVRRSSPLSQIGLRNGDIIVSANGIVPTSPDKWLEIYAQLRSVNQVSLGIVRRGSDTTLEYAIR